MIATLKKRTPAGPLRLAVLTSVETRHSYFANALRRRFDLAACIYARPGYAPATIDDSDLTPQEQMVVRAHFEERGRMEQQFFGHDASLWNGQRAKQVLHIEPGHLSTPATRQFLENQRVNVVAVFGTDLIRPPLLPAADTSDGPDWIMINMHLGLSPYYRGTATNFYPLLNEEPQYVGATIHQLDAGIDTGPIFQHATPVIEWDDRPHSIGCKAIRAGIHAMIDVLESFERGKPMRPVPQWKEPRARVYLRRDYHPRQVVELYKKWDEGLLERYLAREVSIPRLIQPQPKGRSNKSMPPHAPATVCG